MWLVFLFVGWFNEVQGTGSMSQRQRQGFWLGETDGDLDGDPPVTQQLPPSLRREGTCLLSGTDVWSVRQTVELHYGGVSRSPTQRIFSVRGLKKNCSLHKCRHRPWFQRFRIIFLSKHLCSQFQSHNLSPLAVIDLDQDLWCHCQKSFFLQEPINS